MSKLDDILEFAGNYDAYDLVPEAKQQLKDLMLELVGDDKAPHPEEILSIYTDTYLSAEEEAQNELKAELRRKIKAL